MKGHLGVRDRGKGLGKSQPYLKFGYLSWRIGCMMGIVSTLYTTLDLWAPTLYIENECFKYEKRGTLKNVFLKSIYLSRYFHWFKIYLELLWSFLTIRNIIHHRKHYFRGIYSRFLEIFRL